MAIFSHQIPTELTFEQLGIDEVFEFEHRYSDGTGLGPWRKTSPIMYTRASGPFRDGGPTFKFRVDTVEVAVVRLERK